MSWNIDKVKEIVAPILDKDEKILSIGLFRKGPPWWFALFDTGAIPTVAYMCITSKQIFSIPVNVGDFEADKMQSHSFEDVQLNGNELVIRNPTASKPTRLHVIGTPKLAGVDMDEFRNMLKRSGRNDKQKI